LVLLEVLGEEAALSELVVLGGGAGGPRLNAAGGLLVAGGFEERGRRRLWRSFECDALDCLSAADGSTLVAKVAAARCWSKVVALSDAERVVDRAGARTRWPVHVAQR
jgi:hypothetical protein